MTKINQQNIFAVTAWRRYVHNYTVLTFACVFIFSVHQLEYRNTLSICPATRETPAAMVNGGWVRQAWPHTLQT